MNNIDKKYFKEAKEGLLGLDNNIYDIYYFLSPGRIELCGNHTDHNNGKVLTSSIDLYIYACAKKSNNNRIVIKSFNHNVIDIDLDEVINNIDNKEYINNKKQNNKSYSLVFGIIYKFIKLGYSVGGLTCYTISSIPQSAGVSSSASFENLVCKMLSYFYNEDKLTELEIANISKYSENEFFGKPCGLLDQCAISFGGVNYIDFKDIKNPTVKKINNIDISNEYSFVLINTGSHAALTPYYASIKQDMENISSYFNKKVLREVDVNDVINKKEELINKYGNVAYNRAIHFFNENERVDRAYNALLNSASDKKYLIDFLNCLSESGKSSYYYLQNCYCESEEEDLPKGIKYCIDLDKEAYVRVHGGGFAGTILMVINKSNIKKTKNELIKHFGKDNIKQVNLSKYGTCFLKEEKNGNNK